jgi:16S rRNA (guanine527-N7)-methyltransferase
MAHLLEKASIRLLGHQLQQLWRYHNLLRKYNETRELTRIIGFENTVIKHYVDCMIVGQYVKLPSPLVDIGTGAGFPGIPLKILFPHLELTLAEPRPKRIEFLQIVIQTLGLKNTRVFEHRVVSRSFQEPMAGAITRAVETIDKTILRTSACLSEGGRLIFLKGPNVDPELKEMQRQDTAYSLPGTRHNRRLVVLEKLIPAQQAKNAIEEESSETSESVED